MIMKYRIGVKRRNSFLLSDFSRTSLSSHPAFWVIYPFIILLIYTSTELLTLLIFFKNGVENTQKCVVLLTIAQTLLFNGPILSEVFVYFCDSIPFRLPRFK